MLLPRNPNPQTSAPYGIVVFPSLTAAIHAGYQVEQPTQTGYLVRTRTADGWARALVKV